MKKNSLLIALALSVASGVASAHVGADGAAHHQGFVDGLVHPFTGIDHLAAMLAVGIWSAGSAQRRWMAPLTFVAMLLAGALLARAGVAFPAVETMIAGSLLAAGVLLLAPKQLPLGGLVMGGFALFHGAAHGVELAGYAALAGMVMGTATLHLLGIGLGLQMRRHSLLLPRIAGGAIALLGLGLLA